MRNYYSSLYDFENPQLVIKEAGKDVQRITTSSLVVFAVDYYYHLVNATLSIQRNEPDRYLSSYESIKRIKNEFSKEWLFKIFDDNGIYFLAREHIEKLDKFVKSNNDG